MLQLINYDLQEPVKNYPALQNGVENAGGGIHILNGPWVYGADKSPRDVLMIVSDSLKKAAEEAAENGALDGEMDDKLLVFPVQAGEIGAGRNLAPQPVERREGPKVVAVAYTLRNPRGDFNIPKHAQKRHRVDLTDALRKLGATCHPMESLWLLKTDRSPHEVHLELEKGVPLNPKDELMVTEIDLNANLNGCRVKGAEKGLKTSDHDWLVEAGVL